MNKYRNLVAAMWLVACSATAFADSLSEAESEALRQEVETLMDVFVSGNVEPLIDSTHEAAFEWGGGRDVVVPALREAVELVRSSGMEVLSLEVGEPTEVHAAGEEEICFVPNTTLFEILGQQVRSKTFMIAIRDRSNKNEWKFIEGAGLRKYPEMLQELFPELDKGIVLPPNEVTML